MAGAKLSL